MQIQKSFENDDAKLYVVPTPIGNLEDVTLRALTILKKADVIAAEDTRNTQKLLNHFDIKSKLVSYHEHNKYQRTGQLLDDLQAGRSIALVSDAGMPAISDPGYELIEKAIEANVDVVVLPGANAAISALVGSGLPTNQFFFYGFLPRKRREMKEQLAHLKAIPATLIFYESPHRIKQTLQVMAEELGNRKVAVARELTKRFEEYIRGSIEKVLAWSEDRDFKGEICLIIEGGNLEEENDNLWWTHLDIKEHVTHYMTKDEMSSKEAIKKVAKERQMNRREVYARFHII